MKISVKNAAIFTLFVVLAAAVTAPPSSAATQTVQADDFSSYDSLACPGYSDGATFGGWTTEYAGFGCVDFTADSEHWLRLRPMAATTADETHAVMVVGAKTAGDIKFSGKTKTLAQLRQNTAPNAWETSWIVWNYTDNDHFYYFIPKENGWELGKRDPAYPGGQRFLATGNTPKFMLSDTKDFSISQKKNVIDIEINGEPITTFADEERPYFAGRIGFYTEDAEVAFDDILLTQESLSGATVSAETPVSEGKSDGTSLDKQPVASEKLAAAGDSIWTFTGFGLLLSVAGIIVKHKY